jgi:putative transcriptional regulator
MPRISLPHFAAFAAVLLALLLLPATGYGAEAAAVDDDSVVLVAKREMHDPMFGASILVAKPLPDGRTLGFIVNRPSQIKLGQLFPEDGPSQKVVEPVYVGGPVGMNLVFALVQSREAPDESAVRLAPDLYLAIDAAAVDKVIRMEPAHVRYFAGFVVWRPGELQEEMKRGFWHEMQLDTNTVLRKKTDGLWEDLVGRSELRAKTI